MKLTTMATTGAAINTLPRYEGNGLDSICRRLGENKLLRAEREKSKLILLCKVLRNKLPPLPFGR